MKRGLTGVIGSFLLVSVFLSQFLFVFDRPSVVHASAGDPPLQAGFVAAMQKWDADPTIFPPQDAVEGSTKQQWKDMIQGWINAIPQDGRQSAFTNKFQDYFDGHVTGELANLDSVWGGQSGYLHQIAETYNTIDGYIDNTVQPVGNPGNDPLTQDQLNIVKDYLDKVANVAGVVKNHILVAYYLLSNCYGVGCQKDFSYPADFNPGATVAVWRPTNYLDFITNPNDDSRNVKFSNLEQVWSDFTSLESMLDQLRAALKPGLTPNQAEGIIQNGSKLLNGADTPVDPNAGNYTCGTGSSGLDIGGAIEVAVCNVVDMFHSLAVELLLGSAYLLAEMVPINNPKNVGTYGTTQNDSVLGNFLGSLVPYQLQAKYLPSTLKLPFVAKVSGSMINVISVLLIVLFILVALANILQININTYAIKKIIPGMIIGFLAAYFGIFIIRAGLEVANYTTNILVSPQSQPGDVVNSNSKADIDLYVEALGNIEKTPVGLSRNVPLTDSPQDKLPDMSLVIKQAVLNIFIFTAAVLMFILSFLLLMRAVIFIVLTPIAPLAIFSAFVPPLKFIWDKWSKTVMNWMFMNVIIALYLWIGMEFFIAANDKTSGLNGVLTGIIGYAMGIATLFFAVQTPFKLAGEASMAMNKWKQWGNTAWGKTGGAALNSGKKNALAAAGLIPGVASTKQWYKEAQHSSERRQKMWSQGLTQKGIDQVREREREIEDREVKNEERYEKEKQRVVDEIELVKGDLSLTPSQRSARIRAINEASANGTEMKAIEAERTAIRHLRESKEGLGYMGSKYIGLRQQEQVYSKRHAEHQEDENLTDQVSMRELARGHGARMHAYQHLVDHAEDSKILAQQSASMARFADTWRYNNDEDLGIWRAKTRNKGVTLNTMVDDEVTAAQEQAALHNYVITEEPAREHFASDEDYRLARAMWERNEGTWKGKSRQVMSNVLNADNFGSHKHPDHGKAILRGVSFEEELNQPKYANFRGNRQLENALVEDRIKAGVAISGAWKRFGEWGKNQDANILVDVPKILEATKMYQEMGIEGNDLAMIRDIENKAKAWDEINSDTTKSREQKIPYLQAVKDSMRTFYESNLVNPRGLAQVAHKLYRDPHGALRGDFDYGPYQG